ncbi:nucleoid-associated protein [Spirosoma aerolatum]|uniref:nucleoid-associated protein n=1 Tax=Spirosoma aerolatum TaxID=1211326 RepID=UPI0009AF217D|nr:nucleoid-associated protein [Spirosoma aerolatum]
MFKPNKVVIHELQKSPDHAGITWFLSDKLAGVKPSDYISLEKMIRGFDREGVFHGYFGEPEINPFAASFKSYFTSQKEDEQFVAFTKEVVPQLNHLLDKKHFARGGYYVFCEYEFENNKGLGIFLVRDTEGTLFKVDDKSHSFQLDKIKYMETDKMAMGCQIDYIKYRSEGQKCLAFTHNRQKEVSDYFVEWIGCQNRKSGKESTEDLYKLIDAIRDELPINPNTNEKVTAEKLKEDIFNLVESEQTKTLDLQTIGKHLFNDNMFFLNKARAHKIEIDSSFKLHKSTFAKYNLFDVKDDDLGIKLKFPKHRFGDRRTIKIKNEGADRKLIIESPSLIDQILRRLEQMGNE